MERADRRRAVPLPRVFISSRARNDRFLLKKRAETPADEGFAGIRSSAARDRCEHDAAGQCSSEINETSLGAGNDYRIYGVAYRADIILE